ncbi:MAG: response regulator transcription factor [Caulobacteraceae bacterium]|nr:response regulator transcription factor [Caulobacteraceae bacterium]
MTTPVERQPEPRAIRPAARDVRRAAVTSGAPGGTSGVDGLRLVFPIIALLLVVVCTVNVLSNLHDASRIGRPLPVWEPVVWEGTSALTDMIGCLAIWFAVGLAPPTGRWARFVAIHVLGSVAYCAIHVGGMVALRTLIYASAGHHYVFTASDALYEYRKDVLAYVGFASLFWFVPLRTALRAPAAAAAPTRVEMFEIVEGTRLLRVPIADILAVRAAGNYVEFLLSDGRRPLMRAPLMEVEGALAPNGFLRTHRSWVINPDRVRAVEPAGSGDYQLSLDGGETVPVSRRFPEALERLRGGPRASAASE